MRAFLKRLLAWLLMCLFVTTGANSADQENAALPSWLEFKSDQGHFSIQFPSTPSIKTTHKDSIIGKVTNHIFVSNINQSNFGVDYSDIPGFALEFTGKNIIYSHASGALLKKTLGKIQSNKDFHYHGHPGKHLIYDIPPVPDKPVMYGEAYLFLVDKRLYVVDATAPVDASTQVRHFLNSLRFD